MSVPRFFAVVAIFVLVSMAWALLGGTVLVRTDSLDAKFSEELKSLWGPKVLTQESPFWLSAGKSAASRASGEPDAGLKYAIGHRGGVGHEMHTPTSSNVTADILHDFRYKGLLWYSTFTVAFKGQYTFKADEQGAAGCFVMPLPPGAIGYDGLSVAIDGKVQPSPDVSGGSLVVPMDLSNSGEAGSGAGKGRTVTVTYATGGQDAWVYTPGPAAGPSRDSQDGCTVSAGAGLSRLDDFALTVTTSFADIDYPKGSRSPGTPATSVAGGGMQAQWKYASTLTSQPMGVVMPTRPNAGPIAARMSFFAPVSLLFFFTVLFTVVVLKGIRLHPMHYMFIAAGFFAFHILMAYLVDIVNIHAAFWICSAVSVVLVVSYLRLAAGVRFALMYAGLAQLVYLVGFSYAFFWVGKTGLAVTIGAILTLFVLMQATGNVNWYEFFGRKNGGKQPAAPIDLESHEIQPPPLP